MRYRENSYTVHSAVPAPFSGSCGGVRASSSRRRRRGRRRGPLPPSPAAGGPPLGGPGSLQRTPSRPAQSEARQTAGRIKAGAGRPRPPLSSLTCCNPCQTQPWHHGTAHLALCLHAHDGVALLAHHFDHPQRPLGAVLAPPSPAAAVVQLLKLGPAGGGQEGEHTSHEFAGPCQLSRAPS